MEGILGPAGQSYVVDDFSYEDVQGSECFGRVCSNICKAIRADMSSGKKALYNESFDDLMKTVLSIMENIDFMKHSTRFHDDELGVRLKQDFASLEPVIVPIFDGMKAMNPSMREWLEGDMPGALEGMDGPSSIEKTEVRACSALWWYYALDSRGNEVNRAQSVESIGRARSGSGLKAGGRLSDAVKWPSYDDNSMAGARSSVEGRKVVPEHMLFHMVPVLKRNNHRKHNSHHWFFQGVCVGLDASLVFLTDCGTAFNETCLARMVYELRMRKDLIGVTARQRVERPNPSFYPCEHTMVPCLKGDHRIRVGLSPCWKCYLAYYLSPAPLQGFEFEATLILNSALFNLVEAMPVLPGPCQLLDWPRMKRHTVIEEYFDLLFNEDTVTTGVRRTHHRRLPDSLMESSVVMKARNYVPSFPKSSVDKASNFGKQSQEQRSPFSAALSGQDIGSDGDNPTTLPSPPEESTCNDVAQTEKAFGDFSTFMGGASGEGLSEQHLQITSAVAAKPKGPEAPGLTLTEFLRVNMRLAEDRVLSFVLVFCTGFGTKWVPGATFYYSPEVSFQTLLTQRRRWINGTVASYFYFFTSQRARLRVQGGFFDHHKAGKNLRLVNLLWVLNLLQFFFVMIAPCVSGIALYNSLERAFDSVDHYAAMIIVAGYMGAYVVWTAFAFCAPRGKVPEIVSVMMFLLGFVNTCCITYALVSEGIRTGMSAVHIILICAMLGPVVVALSQSGTSALLYLLYLPWFLAFSVFFLVYLPSYSFARLWDTTWGNRDTGRDNSIDLSREFKMQQYVFYFNLGLILLNVGLTAILCYGLSSTGQLIFMGVLFSPSAIQILGSIVFLLIVVPLRDFATNSCSTRSNSRRLADS